VRPLVMNILPLLIHLSILPDQLHLMPLLLFLVMLLLLQNPPMLHLHPSLPMLLHPQNQPMLLPNLHTHQPLSSHLLILDHQLSSLAMTTLFPAILSSIPRDPMDLSLKLLQLSQVDSHLPLCQMDRSLLSMPLILITSQVICPATQLMKKNCPAMEEPLTKTEMERKHLLPFLRLVRNLEVIELLVVTMATLEIALTDLELAIVILLMNLSSSPVAMLLTMVTEDQEAMLLEPEQAEDRKEMETVDLDPMETEELLLTMALEALLEIMDLEDLVEIEVPKEIMDLVDPVETEVLQETMDLEALLVTMDSEALLETMDLEDLVVIEELQETMVLEAIEVTMDLVA